MAISIQNVGIGHEVGHKKLEQAMHQSKGGMAGAVVYSERLLEFNRENHPFLNDDFGIAMNQNLAFSGTPEKIHNGTDTAEWTGSNASGVKVTFNQDDARAHSGTITVADYTALGGATVTVGVNGSDTTKTEGGGDWAAATDNDTTATSLASSLNGITGVDASASGAVVTVTITSGNNISKIDTSDGTNLPGTAQAVFIDAAQVGNTWQFAKGSDITVSNFTAISGFINIDKQWAAGDSIEVYGFDVGVGEVGNRVKLEDFINETDFDEWQAFVLPLSTLGLTAGTIDALRFEVITKSGSAPVWYLDDLQVEQTGTPATFKVTTPVGTKFHINEIIVRVEDAFDSTLANATVPNIPINALLGISELTNGIVLRLVQKGITTLSTTLRNLGDFLANGAVLQSVTGDATNTGFTLHIAFRELLILEGGAENNFLSFTINDDLSGLTRFTAFALGSIEV